MNRVWKRSGWVLAAAGLVIGLTVPVSAAEPSRDDLAEEVRRLREEVNKLRTEQDQQRQQQNSAARVDKAVVEQTVNDVLADAEKRAKLLPDTSDKWYEKLSIRGYTQVRYYPFQSYTGADANVPADRAVGEDERTFNIRRGRFVLSGDVSDHVALYAQIDVFGGISSDLDFAVQTRDLYADIAIDSEKEYRFRIGQSKVPFGWVNLQSSSNRAPFERPDGINSAAEGERDIGAYFMWAPAEARQTFKELTSRGLKGSGDYGVVAIGAYTGQGLNQNDVNGETHFVARVSYPFKLPGGQFFEAGVQAYTGHFEADTGPVNFGAGSVTPDQPDRGVRDERVGVTAIWYPQPFGVEAEWNIGRGPQLSSDGTQIDDDFLHGGYVQFNYRIDDPGTGVWFPFVRWHYYDGGRKFARNAPATQVQEVDIGLEWSPWPEIELTAMYTHTLDRTNTRTAPYEQSQGNRFGLQLQFNY